jgi:hypothetical protein
MGQQFGETMIGTPTRKNFTCGICHQNRTYHGWEDAEIFFQDDFIVHVGCLKTHYAELIKTQTLAIENTKAILLLVEKTTGIENVSNAEINKNIRHILTSCLPILNDIIRELEGALNAE